MNEGVTMRSIGAVLLVVCVALAGCDDDAPSDDTAQVFRYTGKTQCANDGLTLAQTNAMLIQGGLDVLESSCGVVIGIAFPAVCGGGTPNINIHRIRKVNIPDAERLGFADVKEIGVKPGVPGTGFQTEDCPVVTP
jgi:hypothetical protein